MIVLINQFTVEPADQDRLIDLLTQATEGSVKAAPGFLSATLHRSLDGRKVTMYARWASREAYEAMRADPGPAALLREALSFARFEQGMYEVVRTFGPVS
jgi:quinol monooxygenase YgiN